LINGWAPQGAQPFIKYFFLPLNQSKKYPVLSLFRTNQLLNNFLLLFYVAILYVHVFLMPQSWEPSQAGILAHSIYQWLPWDSITADITAAILVLLQGIMINFLIADHRLNAETNLFPGFFYLLIASSLPEFTHLSPVHMANTFYIMALINMFAIYNNNKSAGAIFNIGFLIGVGSLFYFSYWILLLVGFSALYILRAFSIREQLMLIVGALVPYLLLGTYYFWYDQLGYFLDFQFNTGLQWWSLFSVGSLPAIGYFKLGLIGLLILLALVSYNQNISRRVRESQKKMSILYWMLFLGMFTLLVQADFQLDHILVIAVPLGILLSFNFTQLSNSWAELLHFFLLLVILFFQYQSLILD
jgi:hypothetical protein